MSIYIIKPREHIRMSENVFKIGMTKRDITKRFKEYPKGSALYFSRKVKEPLRIERIARVIFSSNFIHRQDFGREYFEGSVEDMIINFDDIINKVMINDMILELNEINKLYIKDEDGFLPNVKGFGEIYSKFENFGQTQLKFDNKKYNPTEYGRLRGKYFHTYNWWYDKFDSRQFRYVNNISPKEIINDLVEVDDYDNTIFNVNKIIFALFSYKMRPFQEDEVIEFKEPVTQKMAITKVEEFLSKPITKEYCEKYYFGREVDDEEMEYYFHAYINNYRGKLLLDMIFLNHTYFENGVLSILTIN